MSDIDQDVIEMARGLLDSRVVVRRPPSAAQRRAYHAPPKGPPIVVAKEKRPCSAKARINNHDNKDVKKYTLPPRPPWQPFTRASSLSKIDGYLNSNIEKPDEDNRGKDEESQKPSIYDNRILPQGLIPLSEWLTEQVPSDWAKGYSPESSFVFLPCLQYIKDDLPCVPIPQEPNDQLPYTSSQISQKYKPPRPRTKKHADVKQKTVQQQSDSDEESPSTVNHMRMYNRQGELVHNIYRGKRGAELIKQEIKDLELLLQGIGNPEGSSIVVRYQHDINHLQDMVKSTLKDYVFPPDARPCTPVAVALQEDLMNYPAQHEEIMAKIRRRRDECVEELAAIEEKILHGKT